MSSLRNLAATLALVAVLGAAPSCALDQLPPVKVSLKLFGLATADPGGVYSPLGRSLCNIYNLKRPKDLPACRAQLSSGSVENIERLRSGSAQVAVIQADVLHWAWTGAGPFAQAAPFHDLGVLFTAHDEIVTMLVHKDSGITDIDQVLGKRFAVGVRESGSRATLEALLAAMDLSPADFAAFEVMSVGAQIDALCAGQVDAAAFVVGHPSGYVQRALYDCGARLLPVDSPAVRAATQQLPFLRMSGIPAGTYRDQRADVLGPALTALIVARRDWNAETARGFVAAVRAQEDILRRMHPALRNIDLDRPDGAAAEVGMHPAITP